MATDTNTHLSRDLLYARLVGLQVDVARLREHYQTVVATLPSTPYRDNQVDYVGWAVTSRDGTLVDGVSRIQPQKGGMSSGCFRERISSR